MFDRIGHSVIKLKRIKTGNLVLGDLPEGSYRYLTLPEVTGLREVSEKTDAPILKQVSRKQNTEAKSIDKKTAHKGKTLDMRPGRAVWSEEKQHSAGQGARGMGRGARTQGPGPRHSGAGSRSSSSRPGVKPEWRGSSSRPSGGGAGIRSSSSRPGAKPEWRKSGPRPNVGGSAPRSSSFRPGGKPEGRASGAGYRGTPRPGAKTEPRSSSPRLRSQGAGSAKPTGRKVIPKTMIRVPRSKGPRKK